MSEYEERGLANIVADLQRSLNERTQARLELRHYYGIQPRPLTRREKLQRRIANRWWAIRRRIALWIAPELDEY